MVGFFCNSIYRVILQESPILALFEEVREQTTYLERVIKPHIVNPEMRKMMMNFRSWHREQAQKISDPHTQDAYLAEVRLHALGLATEIPGAK